MADTIDRDREPRCCGEYAHLLVRAADDEELAAAERARLDVHLAACHECRAALADQRIVRMSLADAFALEPSRAFVARVLAEVEPARSWLDRLDFRRLTWRLSPVAAGLALAAAFVVATGQPAVTDAAGLGTTAPAAVSLEDVVEESDFVSLLWAAEGGDIEPADDLEVAP